jgi:hypothetical protein
MPRSRSAVRHSSMLMIFATSIEASPPPTTIAWSEIRNVGPE